MSKLIKCEMPTSYWLPNLHKRPHKSRLSQIQVSALLTSFLRIFMFAFTDVKDHVIAYSENAFSNSNGNSFLVH